MQLTFSPALGHSITLKVPSSHAPSTIHFKVAFDSDESFLRARSDGVKVELWTDLPVQGRCNGEWGALQFTEWPAKQEDKLEGLGIQCSLLGDTDEELGTREENTLYVQIQAPLQRHVGSQYSFTYRLVYPSGHVYWLGTHDSNGRLVVEQGIPGCSIADEWEIGDDGKYQLSCSPISSRVVHLETPTDWSIWLWDSLRYGYLQSIEETLHIAPVV